MWKRRLNGLPDVRPQAVAAGQPQPMRALLRMRWRVDEVAAELADILEQRAVLAHDVVPELARRKFARGSPPSRRATSTAPVASTPPAVWYIGRQSYIRSVGPGVHDAGEGVARQHQPVVVDVGGLRQAGGAGGVDVERAVLDGERAALGRQRARRRTGASTARSMRAYGASASPCSQIFGVAVDQIARAVQSAPAGPPRPRRASA